MKNKLESKIEELEQALGEIQEQIGQLEEQLPALQMQLQRLKGAKPAMQKSLSDYQELLKEFTKGDDRDAKTGAKR